MKDKPVSHKNLNTFHFSSFGERISKINIDVIHQIGKTAISPDENNTFFLESIEKWVDLNYSQDYGDLQKEIGSEIRNLSQIVFRQNEIIEILLKYLKKEGSLGLDAVLELTVALARDLQYEFFPHFPKFFHAIVSHLSTQDTELLEKMFTCLAYLFKFLWRYMIKDIENVYRLFSSLLHNQNKEHIIRFAVESFAFLIRKVQNKPSLFSFIFSELKEHPEQCRGVGELSFEVIRGVKHQFHSCTENVLKLLFQFLGKEKSPQNLVMDSLLHTLQLMARHTSKNHCNLIQNIFCNVINDLLKRIGEDRTEVITMNHLEKILTLFAFWIDYKDGKLISSDDQIIQILINLCATSFLTVPCMKLVAGITASTLTYNCINFSYNQICSIISLIYSYSSDIFIHFTHKMYKYGMFEKDVLPNLLSACLKLIQEGSDSKKALSILAETIVTLKPVIVCGEDIKSFNKLYLYIPSENVSASCNSGSDCSVLENLLFQTLSLPNEFWDKDSKLDLSEVWCALVCLPHIRFLNVEQASDVLQKLVQDLQKYLLSIDEMTQSKIELHSFILCQSYFTYLILCKNQEDGCFTTSFLVELLKKHPKSVSILRIAELHFSGIQKSVTMENLLSFLPEVMPNLASPFHLVRLYTLKILNAFNSCICEFQKQDVSMFAICLLAENIPLNVQDYREKLKWLQKLEYQFLESQFPTEHEELFKKVPIYYLIGMLFVNFRLLWEPSMDILGSYANRSTKYFWDVFGLHLNQITDKCEQPNFSFQNFEQIVSMDESVFCKAFKEFCIFDEKPDIGNHRILLWKAMEKFPDVVEPRNKIVVPLLFRLIANEIVKVDTSMASKESISKICVGADSSSTDLEALDGMNDKLNMKQSKKRKLMQKHSVISKKRRCITEVDSVGKDASMTETQNDSINEEIDKNMDYNDIGNEAGVSVTEEELNEEDSSEDENKNEEDTEERDKFEIMEKRTKRKYSVAKTLVAYLSIFSKFKNPKSMYKTEELQKLYFELLSYHDSLIQKLSFDCIMTYRYKYLSPYKENFYRILDNKTFKTEVVLFSLDAENEIIQQEHRMDVLAILMRILYGKMLHKTGNNTTGKAQANTRRSLVLRFLAGCKADELKMFLDLVFLPFKELLNGSALFVVKNIRESLDLSNIVPLRRQHSALNSLGLIFQNLGNLVPELLPWLLKVLLVITATSTKLLERKEEVLSHCVNLLKSIRILAIMKLIQFFKSFPKYDFLPEEIDAVFEAVVWPMISRLELESVNQPSPLLQLLSTWSEIPRYFILFSKHHAATETLTPLPHIIALYSSGRAMPRVVGVISKIIYQLITTEDKTDTEEEIVIPIKINCSLCLPEEAGNNKENASYGTRLLMPFVNAILKRLETTVLTLAKKKSKRFLSTRDLTILLRISSYIEDPGQCSKMINLLVPFLFKSKIDAECEVLILTTISNLIKKIEVPESFMKLLAPLFANLTNQNSRSALSNVFTTMAELNSDLSEMALVIKKINSFDATMVEEPDYQQRLDGHKEALEIIRSVKEKPVNEDFVRIIIFNSSFMIRTCDDMALRNSSSYLLQELVKIVATVKDLIPEFFKLLIFQTLLPEIHKGLKCMSENKRHEFISVLSTLLHCCKDHPHLKELVMLCHEDKDLDFWENIKHLQVHRRARALLRFSNSLNSLREKKEKISIQYLLTYMIPITQSFLFDDAYKKHVHVIDAAIETLGSIAAVLPWHHYEPLLKQHLNLISKDAEHHKTIVKIVVSLLNAFPYNLNEMENSVNAEIKHMDECENMKEPMDVITADATEKENKVDSLHLRKVTHNVIDDLTPALRNKISNSIKKNILPLLHRSLMKKAKRDDEHKLSGHYYPEDEEILRVPIALAMVKLLQRLPSGTLEKALPGLLLRMCELLKSRTESIRETTRDTLVKMMQSLGPKYFYFLLREIKAVMKRGYQVHVMTFSINAVLTKLMEQMKSGDLDECLKDLSEICTNELFTDAAEEKEVAKITGKVKEARSIKSYSIFHVVSKFISESLLLDLIQPLKEVLFTKHSHKSLKKVSECFRHIALGLSENNGLSEKGLLIFIHAIASESIPGLNPKINKPVEKNSKFERPDIYLVPKEPGRSGPPAKINQKTNVHILVEFGLQIFHFCLKKDKIAKDKQDILEMLDPFVSLLSQCLSSNHMKIISTALRCLQPIYKYSLPSFKELTKNIVESLFILINKYAAVGMGQGDNFEMIVMCFKMMTMLVRDTSYHKFSNDQLHSLLSYVEQDIFDYTRQATAFSLLKAILSKKLEASQLPGIMNKVAEMSVTSEQEYVRSQCRQLCMQYMLDYPLGKKLLKSISFFIAQLEYPHEHGRVSSMETVNSMMNQFPEEVLKQHAALFLVPLSARLVNDESPACRKMAAECIKKLLQKIDHNVRAGLFSIALNWLEAKKMSHKRLGAQICGLFAEVEKEQFEHHLLHILPVYIDLINIANNTEVERPADERCTDHFLYHLLNSLTKMLSFCPVIRKSEYCELFNKFWEELQGMILYPHMWVRIATSQLFGLLLSSYTVEEIQTAIFCEDDDVYINSKQKLRDLSADFATQIQSVYLNDTLGEQAVRNLVYLAKVISAFSAAGTEDDAEISKIIGMTENTDEVQVTLSWMIRKMCREAKKEVAETPSNSLKRKCVFMFIAAISHELDKGKLLLDLDTLLFPLCREIADASKYANEEIKKNAQEVLDLIKTVVGVEDFTDHYAFVQSALSKKKMKRKREKAEEAITDPERYAKKKIKKQLSKKESKKRKILLQKGKRKTKKSTLSSLIIAS